MPIHYAVRTELPEADWREHGRYAITPVAQVVAEANTEDGMSAVFTNTGEQVTPWYLLSRNKKLAEEIAKIAPFPPLNDMFGITLNVGDYAVSAFDERSNYMSACKVVGYTKDKVKVLRSGRIIARNPAMLMRVHESVITPDITLP